MNDAPQPSRIGYRFTEAKVSFLDRGLSHPVQKERFVSWRFREPIQKSIDTAQSIVRVWRGADNIRVTSLYDQQAKEWVAVDVPAIRGRDYEKEGAHV